MAEWLKAAVSKTAKPHSGLREFESLPLRHPENQSAFLQIYTFSCDSSPSLEILRFKAFSPFMNIKDVPGFSFFKARVFSNNQLCRGKRKMRGRSTDLPPSQGKGRRVGQGGFLFSKLDGKTPIKVRGNVKKEHRPGRTKL